MITITPAINPRFPNIISKTLVNISPRALMLGFSFLSNSDRYPRIVSALYWFTPSFVIIKSYLPLIWGLKFETKSSLKMDSERIKPF